MFINSALASTMSQTEQTIRMGGYWLPSLVVFLIIFFLLILPKNRKLKKTFKDIRNLKKGDSVVTSSGIYGKVTKITKNSDTLMLEIAKGTEIKIKKIKIVEVL